jgi:hypothetical protein
MARKAIVLTHRVEQSRPSRKKTSELLSAGPYSGDRKRTSGDIVGSRNDPALPFGVNSVRALMRLPNCVKTRAGFAITQA